MEFSKEEDKAIKELKHYINITPYWKLREYTNSEIDNYIKIVLNLVETLEGKIKSLQYWVEELKKEKRDNLRVVYGGRKSGTEAMVVKDYISKDKIREKINYFEHSFDYDDNGESYELVMEVLEELLEED